MMSPLLPTEVAPPLPADDEEEPRRSPWSSVTDRLRAPFRRAASPSPPHPPSGYLTLIPLSDARLQPRDTRLTAAFLIGFALLVAAVVFLLVPRSVSVGEISVAADRMSWNTSKASYQLRLVATIPVYNPNYLRASVEGDLQVLFYMAEAGRAVIEPTVLKPRSMPKLVHAAIDASDVPADYILSILSQCSTFPEVLVFFLKGKLRARYLFQTQRLATVDTYFMINCRDGGPDVVAVGEGAAAAGVAVGAMRGAEGWSLAGNGQRLLSRDR